MRFVLYGFINDIVHYWNTCGWTRNLEQARRYTHDDARTIQEKMARRAKVWIAPLKANAGIKRERMGIPSR